MIFFTSDLHIGHKNIIKLCNRPFSSLVEMDETLISNWNDVVTIGDTIYIIGDLMFRTQTQPADVLQRLKGKKHLIVGNHDLKQQLYTSKNTSLEHKVRRSY